MQKRKWHSISSTVIKMYTVIGIILLITTIGVISFMYVRHEDERYRTTAYNYTRTLADLIDGDRVLVYAEFGQKDDYYERIQETMNAIKTESNLLYFYVLIPEEDRVMYIWDTDSVTGKTELGEYGRYAEGSKELVDTVYNKNPIEKVNITRDPIYGITISAMTPVFDVEGEPVAIVGAEMSANEIQSTIRWWIINIFIYLVVVIGAFMVIAYYISQRYLVRPIIRVTKTANEMIDNIENKKEVVMDIHTANEIETMAHSFEKMYVGIINYIDQLQHVTQEKERIGTELLVATQIQADMLPRNFPYRPDLESFDLYASMRPAKEVGGDFYDFFMIDDDHLAVSIGDVSGKGVPAALFMVISKTLIKNYTSLKLSPEKVFNRVNNDLCEGNDTNQFTTAWLGILELSTGKLVYANAGHEKALRITNNGEVEEIVPKKTNIVLASFENINYCLNETILQDGERLFIYTDGVPEATNSREELFGMPRLKAILQGCQHMQVQEIIKYVGEEVDAFVGEAPQFDDLTMLALAYKK